MYVRRFVRALETTSPKNYCLRQRLGLGFIGRCRLFQVLVTIDF